MPKYRFPVLHQVKPTSLKEPIRFVGRPVKTRNRFVKAAMSEKLCDFFIDDPKSSGIPDQRLINLYEKFGNGVFGMIITGNVMVDHTHLEAPGNALITKEIDSKTRREQFAKLAKAAKSDGALVVLQLNHAGRQTPDWINPRPFSASNVQLRGVHKGNTYGIPVPLTNEQIRTEVVERFVYAAKLAHKAGKGYLLHARQDFPALLS
ncbi:Protein T10B5.8 [Aphelenchoides avenae]|nr:Protein T10B5.8 [Aphelenchus avenae]